MRSIRLAASVASLAILAACASAPSKEAADPKARIAADVAWLADDARMGRDPGTPGYDAAADYVENRMKSVGLKPAAIGWRQTAPLRSSTRVVNAAKFELVSGGATSSLTPIDDYIIGRSFDDPTFSVTAPLVYVGYGVVAPDEGVDDYVGLDVAGKIVVAFSGGPPSMNTEKRAHYSSSDVKFAAAAARGAVGYVSIMTKHDAEQDNWKHVAARISSPAMETIGPDGKAEVVGETIKASASLSVSGATKVFEGARVDYATLMAAEAEGKGAPKGFALNRSATLAGASMLSDVKSDNVIGVIEGSDPVLRDEVVLLTAHLDHIGLTPSKNPGDDEINNGALDNASGVAVMLEAARAFKASGVRPKRTIAFAALTAEEKGLLGSSYLAGHPAFGGKRVVANVNLDMPIAIYPFTDVVAFGAERSSLGPVVRRAAEEMGLVLAADPMPEENIFVRSDHYSFVKKGVPAVFLVPGFANGGAQAFASFLKDHYHKPSDEISLPIDYDALARFSDLNYRVARDLADDAQTPAWVEGDFFGELFSK